MKHFAAKKLFINYFKLLRQISMLKVAQNRVWRNRNFYPERLTNSVWRPSMLVVEAFSVMCQLSRPVCQVSWQSVCFLKQFANGFEPETRVRWAHWVLNQSQGRIWFIQPIKCTPILWRHHFSRAFRITNNWAIIACRRTFRLSRRHLKTALGSSEATALHFLALNKTWHTTQLISNLCFVNK